MITKEQLEAAQLKRTELDLATDELNADLASLEALLKGLRLGVSARTWLTAQSTDDLVKRELGFEKLRGVWRLSYVHDGSPSPLAEAPRSMRLLAVDALPRLIQALLMSVQVEVTKVEDATEKLDAIIDEVALHSAKKGSGK